MPNRAQRRAAKFASNVPKQSGDTPGTAHIFSPVETAGVSPFCAAPLAAEPGKPFPSLAQLNANRAKAQLSTGPINTTNSSQNRTIHGLARHNGAFKLLPTEDPNGFEALKQSLQDEHQPTTETEAILVNTMAESHWLANRAQILTDSCFDPETGQIANEKMFALYLRYQTTHIRAFHKSLNDLLKLRAEARKAAIGFEAQRVQTEKHEMKKQSHYWDVLKKDGQACRQIAQNTIQRLDAIQQHPCFEARYAADLAAHNLKKGDFQTATRPPNAQTRI